MSHPVDTQGRAPACAQCRKRPVSPDYRPFCSKRCADIDLGQWLNDGYAIPGEPIEAPDGAHPEEPSSED